MRRLAILWTQLSRYFSHCLQALVETQQVELVVYDVLGREIQRVADQFLATGLHQFEVDFSDVPAGLYFYRLRVGDSTQLSRTLIRK